MESAPDNFAGITTEEDQITIHNPSHKMVLDNLIDGMPKLDAYNAAYPKCNTASSAYKQINNWFKNEDYRLYYENGLERKKYFVNKKNQLNIDGVAATNMRMIKLAEEIARTAEKDSDRINAINTVAKITDLHSRQLGLGTFDPSLKNEMSIKIKALEAQVQQAESKLLVKDDTALEDMINVKATVID